MSKLLFFSFFLICTSIASSGQDSAKIIFAKPKFSVDTTIVSTELTEEHFLGNEVASRWYHVKMVYSFIEKGSPTSPGDKTVIKRPSIYYSLKKIDKSFKKKIKKGEIDSNLARIKLLKYLTTSLYLYYTDTKDLESILKDADDVEAIQSIFDRIEFK